MPLILGTNSIKDTGYDVANSLRLNSGSSDNLEKTYSSAQSNGSIATFSVWIKRGNLGSRNKIIGAYDGGSAGSYLEFFTDNTIRYHSGSGLNTTNAVFRDPSAWLHIVVLHNTGGSGASNQVKIYVNGSLQTLSANNGATVNSQIGKNSVMPCIIESKIKCNTGIKKTLLKYAHSYKELVWKEKPLFMSESDLKIIVELCFQAR